MKSRAALLLLLATIFAVEASPTTPATITTSPAITTQGITKNRTLSTFEAETYVSEPNELVPNPELVHPFTNPKNVLLQEIRSLDEDAVTAKVIGCFLWNYLCHFRAIFTTRIVNNRK